MIKVVEIFRTVEGEGKWVGLPVSFIRLEGCNLRCEWCDTPYSYDGKSFKEITVDSLIEKVEKFGLKRVCITGGEPFLTPQLPELAGKLIKRGYAVLIETNGTLWNEDIKKIENKNLYITCSPKPHAPTSYTHSFCLITRLKFVVDESLKLENILNNKDKI
ncbi:MAG: 7-carboxy-7-deazaguanine synthase QueE [Persephonella sp.]|nr:7-carboxy-7-deazaguanine synthase QueE [Persephonella sp.]